LDGDLNGIPYPQEILDLCEVTPIDATALLKLSRSGVKIPTLARFIRESIYWLLASEDVGEAGVDAVLALFEFLPATIRSTMVRFAAFLRSMEGYGCWFLIVSLPLDDECGLRRSLPACSGVVT
jgi:hypothetical protein